MIRFLPSRSPITQLQEVLPWSIRRLAEESSFHDRPHIKWMVETYPKQMEVVVTPYSARTRMAGVEQVEATEEGRSAGDVGKMGEGEEPLWATFQKHDAAWFGIKPSASTALFKGDSSPGNPHADEDSKIARVYRVCGQAERAEFAHFPIFAPPD